MSEQHKLILDYAPSKSPWIEWLARNHYRIKIAGIGFGLVAVLYCTNVTLLSYTLDDPTRATATRYHLIALGKYIVYSSSEPATFCFSGIISPANDVPIPTGDPQMYRRELSRRHFGRNKHHFPEIVECRSGIWALRTYRLGIQFVQSRMPDASRDERRDVLIEILRRTACIEGSRKHGDRAVFDLIAEDVLNEMCHPADLILTQ